jgi:hypothetical protein
MMFPTKENIFPPPVLWHSLVLFIIVEKLAYAILNLRLYVLPINIMILLFYDVLCF